MATEVPMPKLGLTMQEGTITEWLVPDGGPVEAGTAIMIIETDKVETEVDVDAGGVLQHVAAVGDTIACGDPVAYVTEAGETAPQRAAAPVAATAAQPAKAERPAPALPTPSPNGNRIIASPNARRVAGELGVELATVTGTGPGGRIVGADVAKAAERVATPAPGAFVTFAARQAATRLGVDLATVVARGPDGRISRADVYAAARSTPARQAVPMKGMRGLIAERMHASLQEMAQLTLTMDADMTRAVDLRNQFKEAGSDVVPGFTDMVIAAAARALRVHPAVNSSITEQGIELLPDVNVGMAVALDEGLVVPVVTDADRLPLIDLAEESTRLATAARSKQLTMAELEGATFSVTSLGMYGVDAFTPIINPPNAAILGVGRIREDGAMTLSLTWDHRVLDGAPAAAFTATIRDLLQAPFQLLD